jgi:hypothetical protein
MSINRLKIGRDTWRLAFHAGNKYRMSHALNVIFVTRSSGSVSTEAEVLAKTRAGSG